MSIVPPPEDSNTPEHSDEWWEDRTPCCDYRDHSGDNTACPCPRHEYSALHPFGRNAHPAVRRVLKLAAGLALDAEQYASNAGHLHGVERSAAVAYAIAYGDAAARIRAAVADELP